MSGDKHPPTQKPASAQNPLSPAPGLSPANDHEAATASEIRIKLDLARQFLDMGDPESARYMLDEVLSEGDASQKQEAMRLIESLP